MCNLLASATLTTLRRAEEDFRWKFDPEAAERKLALVELLPHTKGEWAFKGQLVTLEPWQKFGLMATFGWVNKRTGKRRFRESYWGGAEKERQIGDRGRRRYRDVRAR
jgi:phage terminase large subunit-like protein